MYIWLRKCLDRRKNMIFDLSYWSKQVFLEAWKKYPHLFLIISFLELQLLFTGFLLLQLFCITSLFALLERFAKIFKYFLQWRCDDVFALRRSKISRYFLQWRQDDVSLVKISQRSFTIDHGSRRIFFFVLSEVAKKCVDANSGHTPKTLDRACRKGLNHRVRRSTPKGCSRLRRPTRMPQHPVGTSREQKLGFGNVGCEVLLPEELEILAKARVWKCTMWGLTPQGIKNPCEVRLDRNLWFNQK